MEDIKFKWVLRAMKGGLFSLHQICDGEIVWKRGYAISNIEEYRVQQKKITIYRMGKGGTSTNRVNQLRRQSQLRNCITSQTPCTFIVEKDAADNIIDVTKETVIALLGLRARIEPKSMSILEARASKYDELAPPEDVNKKSKVAEVAKEGAKEVAPGGAEVAPNNIAEVAEVADSDSAEDNCDDNCDDCEDNCEDNYDGTNGDSCNDDCE